MKKLVAVYNAAAGGAGRDAQDTALRTLRTGADVVTAALDDPDDITDVLAAHPDRGPVAFGGDGSVHALVVALHKRGELGERVVGLIPLGTGNDLARALGIPLDPEAAAQAILHGRERSLDLLEDDDGGIVVNAVHLGVGAEASRQAVPLKPWLRRVAYAVGGVLAGLRTRGWQLSVMVDEQPLTNGRRRVLMVGVGNGVTIGGGTPLLPAAKPGDGMADVIVSFATSPLSRLAYGWLLRRGDHTARDDVIVRQGRRVTVDGELVPVNADGELTGSVRHRTWQIRHHGWRIMTPA